MASDLHIGFRFSPTNEEMVQCLQYRLDDLGNPKIALLPNISMRDHEPSEFMKLCPLEGRDGEFYFFGIWDRYGKGERLDRKVKKDSMKARWKEVSQLVKIESSDGTQIGTRKNFTFEVDDSSTEWHMEEYRLCGPAHEHSKVSICRVSRKCSPARRTAKIPAKGDNRFGEPRHSTAAENQSAEDTVLEMNEVTERVNLDHIYQWSLDIDHVDEIVNQAYIDQYSQYLLAEPEYVDNPGNYQSAYDTVPMDSVMPLREQEVC